MYVFLLNYDTVETKEKEKKKPRGVSSLERDVGRKKKPSMSS